MPELTEKKILILEDDVLITMVIKRYFTRLGYKVDSETNGKLGLEYLETTDKLPDIILSDIMMPHVSGIEFIKSVRREQKYDQIPVFAITSMANELSEDKNKNLGFKKIIQKPFSLPELAADIQEILDERK